jgi:hypothetical protein
MVRLLRESTNAVVGRRACPGGFKLRLTLRATEVEFAIVFENGDALLSVATAVLTPRR